MLEGVGVGQRGRGDDELKQDQPSKRKQIALVVSNTKQNQSCQAASTEWSRLFNVTMEAQHHGEFQLEEVVFGVDKTELFAYHGGALALRGGRRPKNSFRFLQSYIPRATFGE